MKIIFYFNILIVLIVFSLSNCTSNKYSLKRVTYNAAQEIQNRTNLNDTIAVMDASLLTGNLNKQIITWLENHLLITGKFKIVSRQRINTIMREINFGFSGYINDETAQRIGKFLGAKYILVFELIDINNKSYLNIQVLETETGTLVYSNSFRINNSEIDNNRINKKSFRF